MFTSSLLREVFYRNWCEISAEGWWTVSAMGNSVGKTHSIKKRQYNQSNERLCRDLKAKAFHIKVTNCEV